MFGRPVQRQGLLILCLLAWAGYSQDLTAQSLRVTHFAGTPGGGAFADGPGSSARFNRLQGVATDSAGNVYVADSNNQVIRRIDASGVVTTFAGSPGKVGFDDGPGAAARFSFPQGIAADATGNVYVADSSNSTIRKITPDGTVSTLAGSPGVMGSTDGTGAAALFFFPVGIATDSAGNVYVEDSDSDFQPQGQGFSTIRKITPAGIVRTLAGSSTVRGYANGTGTNALFDFGTVGGIVVDGAGNVYVADTDNIVIRKLTPEGVVTTIAGTPGLPGSPGFGTRDGAGSDAQFESPSGITIDLAGNLFVADGGANTIRRVTPAGVVTTIAGTPNTYGLVDGIGTAARFDGPVMLASDGSNLYIPDSSNNAVRKVVIATASVTTLAGGSIQEQDSIDGVGTLARFVSPSGLATDGANLYVTDNGFFEQSVNSTIRRIALATGAVTTLAGTPRTRGSSDGIGSAARFRNPQGLATDGVNLYVADTQNSTIRRIVLATGETTTLAGTPQVAGSVDGPVATSLFNRPRGISTDGANLYVTDGANSNVRKIALAAGQVTTLVGTAGRPGSADGTGAAALFGAPSGITSDGANLYVTDMTNFNIRKIALATTEVSTLAGTAGVSGSADGIGAAALFTRPLGIATDGVSLYVTDTDNDTIRVLDLSTGRVTTPAGLSLATGAVDGAGGNVRFFAPIGITFANSSIYIADAVNAAIRRAVCGADDPVSPIITPQGNPTGPVTGVDYLDLSWSPPASGLSPSGYDWAINGDAFTSTNATSATIPPRASNDPITLHVRSRACSPEVTGTAVDSATYSPAPPVASFSVSRSGRTFTFTDTSTPQATSWLWLFGDGSTSTSQSTTHTYPTDQVFTVVLIATNGAGSDETSQPTSQSLGIAPSQIRTEFDTIDPRRQKLSAVRLARPGDARLHVTPLEPRDAIVYLRMLDPSGRLGTERRLSIAPGQEAVYDLGAFGLQGTWDLELVSTQTFSAFIDQPRPRVPVRVSRASR